MTEWRRSTRCLSGTCIEARIGPQTVTIRDSKQLDSTVERVSEVGHAHRQTDGGT